jgi:hypothetical protein
MQAQARSRASSPGEAPAGADCQIVSLFVFVSYFVLILSFCQIVSFSSVAAAFGSFVRRIGTSETPGSG